MKKCFKCGSEKDRSEFYAHPGMKDGLLGKCKACTRRDSEARRAEKIKTDPDWVRREADRQRKKSITSNWEHPAIHRARRATRKIRKTTAEGLHLHHWSYLEEHKTDVIDLSPSDHRKAHRYMVLDFERLQYRRVDTMELLDTKEGHTKYIMEMIKTKPD